MEYRGYDSAGVAVSSREDIKCIKSKGRVALLKQECGKEVVKGTLGVGQGGELGAAPRNLRDGQNTAYTQQEGKQLMDRNSAEENALQMRLVERLIQQQEAIRASIPEQGKRLTFKRALQLETNTDLQINLNIIEIRGIPIRLKLTALASVLILLPCLKWLMQGALLTKGAGSQIA